MKKLIAILIVFCMLFLAGCTSGVKGNTYSDDESSIYFKDSTNCIIIEDGKTYNCSYEKTTDGYTITAQLGLFEIEFYIEIDGDYIIVTKSYSDSVQMLKKE